MIKIDVISGFLGAGKTTLIEKLFSSKLKNEKVVLIENEFGEIGIDGSFLKGSGIEIKEINAGCICCSLVGDFASSIKELISKYSPDRIIIEPSGVGKLSDIVGAIEDLHDEELKVNILCTVVDGKKAKLQLRNFGEFFSNQVMNACAIVVTKVDLIDETKLQETVDVIKEVNEKANIITTPLKELDSDKLLEFLEEKSSLKEELIKEVLEMHEHDEDEECECCCGDHEHHHHHHHHDEDEECECCCGEHEHHHHHHHDEEEECECSCGEHEHHHHHHDEDEECECSCGEHEHHHHHHHHGHDADEVFTSWGLETVKSVTKEQLTHFLDNLNNDSSLGIVLRSKGILKAKDNEKWYYFDFVSGDYEIRLGEPDYTGRVVVIGSKLDEEKLEKLFKEI